MKKILLGILVFAGMTSYSQSSETLLEGTVIKAGTSNSLALIQDNETGKIYGAWPKEWTLPSMDLGVQVSFTLRSMDAGSSQVGIEKFVSGNMQKSRHDAMMATIQNTR